MKTAIIFFLFVAVLATTVTAEEKDAHLHPLRRAFSALGATRFDPHAMHRVFRTLNVSLSAGCDATVVQALKACEKVYASGKPNFDKSVCPACPDALSKLTAANLAKCTAEKKKEDDIDLYSFYAMTSMMCTDIDGKSCADVLNEVSSKSTKCGPLTTQASCTGTTGCEWKSNKCDMKQDKSFLDSLCHPCMMKALNKVFSLGLVSDGGALVSMQDVMNTLCMKEDGNYCALQFDLSTMGTSTSPTDMIGMVCGDTTRARCFNKMMSAMTRNAASTAEKALQMCLKQNPTATTQCNAAYTAALKQPGVLSADIMSAYCAAKDGVSCLTLLQTYFAASDTQQCLAKVAQGQCSDGCVNAMASKIGCCGPAASAIGMGQMLSMFSQCQQVSAIFQGAPCTAGLAKSKVGVKRKIGAKIAWSDIERNAGLKDKLKNAMLSDVLASIGSTQDDVATSDLVKDSSIKVTVPGARFAAQATTDGTALSFMLLSSSEAKTAALSKALDTAVQGDLLVMSSASQVMASCTNCATPSGSVEVDKTASLAAETVVLGSMASLSATLSLIVLALCTLATIILV